MGEVHPLFAAWLICQSLMEEMASDEHLIDSYKYKSASCEADESDDWGASQNIEDVEEDVLDWGDGEFVNFPTTERCDNLVFGGETNVKH